MDSTFKTDLMQDLKLVLNHRKTSVKLKTEAWQTISRYYCIPSTTINWVVDEILVLIQLKFVLQ